MDDKTLIVFGIFGVVFSVLYIADIFKFRTLRDALQPYYELALPRVDATLAPYGDALQPAHELFAAALTLLDQDSDTLVKALPPVAVTKLRELLGTAEMLTDGEIEPEVLTGTPPAGAVRS